MGTIKKLLQYAITVIINNNINYQLSIEFQIITGGYLVDYWGFNFDQSCSRNINLI